MPNVSVSGFAAQLHSSPPRRSDNAVDRNQRPMSNARRNVAGAPKRNRNALRPLRGIEIDSQSCRAVGRGQLASRVWIICDDISEFESYMPSQAVRSPEANM